MKHIDNTWSLGLTVLIEHGLKENNYYGYTVVMIENFMVFRRTTLEKIAKTIKDAFAEL